tara:strand:+ start:3363 stop:4133 length:771 start_codon:yes stop_codon:yes gene_type:complete
MGIWGSFKSVFSRKKKTISSVVPRVNKKRTREYKGNRYTVFKGRSNYIWILDSGHGGMIDGTYQTEGKRSPKWEDGTQLFEGVSNREMIGRITKKLEQLNISYINLVHTEQDTPLRIRTDLANLLYKEEMKRSKKKMIYISVHSDAWKTTKARGWSVFTSPGQTLSDKVAQHFALKFKQIFRKERLRKDDRDGDLDFEARFWVLRKTMMPAILTENFFMTNPHECKDILMNNEGRRLIAKIHYESIVEIDRIKLIG